RYSPTGTLARGVVATRKCRINRNFRFSSQQPHTIYPARESRALFFLWLGPGLGTRVPSAPTRVPKLLTTAFPSGFVRPPPFAVGLDRFPGSHSLGYPAGSDSPAIRRSILPNNRFVSWLSANSS